MHGSSKQTSIWTAPRALLILALGLLFAVSACSTVIASNATPVPTATTQPTPTSARVLTVTSQLMTTPTVSTTTSPAATTTSDTTPALVLDPQWYVDSNGNGIPDFIETQLGYDPKVDGCAAKACGQGVNGLGLDLASKTYNTLIILDSSGSMAEQTGGGESKMAAAKAAVIRHVQTSPAFIKYGFMVYGNHGNNTDAGKAESCAGIDVLAPLGGLTGQQVQSLVAQFQPTGWTPIEVSLRKAAQVFAGQEGQINRIVLVTDGIETCGGHPVQAAQDLHTSGISVVIDVVGFDVGNADAEGLKQIAQATGGTYTDVHSQADLNAFFDAQIKNLKQDVEQTLSDFRCETGNLATITQCQTSLTSQASKIVLAQYTQALQQGNQAQANAYFQIYNQIVQKSNASLLSKLGQSSQRADQVLQRLNELDQELISAVGKRGSP